MTDMILAKSKSSPSPQPQSRPRDEAGAPADPSEAMASDRDVMAAAQAMQVTPEVGAAADASVIDLIELLFFAYRDFIGDPDAILDELAFGRAHHRVLYFIDRNPGMTVAALLDILKITKQSLGRVLRDLIEAGFVVQRPGEADRRQRLLYATPGGQALARRLTEPQVRRVGAALAALGPDSSTVARRFLRLLINETDRETPTGMVARP